MPPWIVWSLYSDITSQYISGIFFSYLHCCGCWVMTETRTASVFNQGERRSAPLFLSSKVRCLDGLSPCVISGKFLWLFGKPSKWVEVRWLLHIWISVVPVLSCAGGLILLNLHCLCFRWLVRFEVWKILLFSPLRGTCLEHLLLIASGLSSMETFPITPTPLERSICCSPIRCHVGWELLIKRKPPTLQCEQKYYQGIFYNITLLVMMS